MAQRFQGPATAAWTPLAAPTPFPSSHSFHLMPPSSRPGCRSQPPRGQGGTSCSLLDPQLPPPPTRAPGCGGGGAGAGASELAGHSGLPSPPLSPHLASPSPGPLGPHLSRREKDSAPSLHPPKPLPPHPHPVCVPQPVRPGAAELSSARGEENQRL